MIELTNEQLEMATIIGIFNCLGVAPTTEQVLTAMNHRSRLRKDEGVRAIIVECVPLAPAGVLAEISKHKKGTATNV